MDRGELAGFLRSRRERIAPSDVGLDAGPRRRTPGLRREEVAQIAGISVDYYTRLEQARGPRPSRQVLESLARALRLSTHERAHLFHLVDEPAATPSHVRQDVPDGILRLLRRLEDCAAFVLDAKSDVLAWNPLAAALIVDFSAYPPGERNLVWLALANPTGPRPRMHYSAEDAGAFAREMTADLRAAAARYPDDPGIRQLVRRLLDRSERFGQLWSAHEVTRQHSRSKRVDHALVGEMELESEVLLIPDRDQRLVIYSAAPGSPSHEALRLLAVVGVQDLGDDPAGRLT